jgi:hypothetical protein
MGGERRGARKHLHLCPSVLKEYFSRKDTKTQYGSIKMKTPRQDFCELSMRSACFWS